MLSTPAAASDRPSTHLCTFSDMLHAMKQYNKLRGDNVISHDDGDVEFNGVIIDNMHSWAP
ncbi:hypothetical protein FSB65_28440 [Paraburkholderia sp. JPY418]|nr:hypothetical protein [Paraburkholderia youngii]